MLYINICKKNQANVMLIRRQKRACISQIRVQASLIHNKTIILFTKLTIRVVIYLRIIKFAKSGNPFPSQPASSRAYI